MNAGLVLAAGASRRLGRPKQVVEVDGRALVCHTIANLLAADCERVLVVVGAYEAIVRKTIAAEFIDRVRIAYHPKWSTGQASSLALGLRHLESFTPELDHAIITVCDQPRVSAFHYRQLSQSLDDSGKRVAAARYESGGGVPICASRSTWNDLAKHLEGDQGAKSWLRQLPKRSVELIDIPEAKFDIDSPRDLVSLTRNSSLGSQSTSSS